MREKLFRAYTTRASSLDSSSVNAVASVGGGEGAINTDNTTNNSNNNNNEPLIERALELRKSLAALLGHGSYADCSVSSKVFVR